MGKRAFPYSKLIEATPDGGTDGRPLIDDLELGSDPLLNALWTHHAQIMPRSARLLYAAEQLRQKVLQKAIDQKIIDDARRRDAERKAGAPKRV